MSDASRKSKSRAFRWSMIAVSLARGTLAVAAPAADSSFAAMDANGDGKISREEHAAATRHMFATMDANRDGKVTAQEMDAGESKIAGRAPQPGDLSSADKIKVIDADHDGVLTSIEHISGSRQMFDAMDVNRDGFLTPDELAAGHAGLHK